MSCQTLHCHWWANKAEEKAGEMLFPTTLGEMTDKGISPQPVENYQEHL